MLRVDGVPEVQAAAQYFARLEAPTRAAIREQSRAWAPQLVRAAAARARGEVEAALAQSGRTTVSTRGLVAVFGSSGSFKGTPLRELTGFEFGAYRDDFTRYLSRRNGRAFTVTRRTKKQMRQRNKDGWFIFPAVAQTTPALVSAWLRAITEVARGR